MCQVWGHVLHQVHEKVIDQAEARVALSADFSLAFGVVGLGGWGTEGWQGATAKLQAPALLAQSGTGSNLKLTLYPSLIKRDGSWATRWIGHAVCQIWSHLPGGLCSTHWVRPAV